jgi:hypothetical protein
LEVMPPGPAGNEETYDSDEVSSSHIPEVEDRSEAHAMHPENRPARTPPQPVRRSTRPKKRPDKYSPSNYTIQLGSDSFKRERDSGPQTPPMPAPRRSLQMRKPPDRFSPSVTVVPDMGELIGSAVAHFVSTLRAGNSGDSPIT